LSKERERKQRGEKGSEQYCPATEGIKFLHEYDWIGCIGTTLACDAKQDYLPDTVLLKNPY
jgi:hypothetical protein